MRPDRTPVFVSPNTAASKAGYLGGLLKCNEDWCGTVCTIKVITTNSFGEKTIFWNSEEEQTCNKKCMDDEPACACFGRDRTAACRLLDGGASAAAAHSACWGAAGSEAGGGAAVVAAELVLMLELVAGDLVLTKKGGVPSVDRVVVNQHRQHTACTAELLTLVHAAGSLSRTPGHVVWLRRLRARALRHRRFGPLQRRHHHCDHRALGRHHQPNCCGRHHPRFGQGGRRPCARDDGRRVDGQRPPLGLPQVQPLVRARCTVPRDRPGVLRRRSRDALPCGRANPSHAQIGRAGAACRPRDDLR